MFKISKSPTLKHGVIALGVILFSTAPAAYLRRISDSKPETQRIPVEFSGGHDTDPRDHGRPVILIASALKVPPSVFRETFRHVHPAPAGTPPTPEEQRANKQVLLDGLSPYGVDNDRLDEVSNYYRYVRSRGEMWPIEPASAVAIVRKGVVIRIKIMKGGSGYTSSPTIDVPGYATPAVKIKLAFGDRFETNGSVAAITIQKSR